MNILLKSDREVFVRVRVRFKNVDNFWETEQCCRMSGVPPEGLRITVVGRLASEIEHLVLYYDDNELKIHPQIDDDGNTVPITLYDGSRDHWAHVLHNAALSVDPDEADGDD